MFEKDLKILESLWRWKCLSTAALTEMHFSDLEATAGYRRLLFLREQDLIQRVSPVENKDGELFFWPLTKKGFKRIRPIFPVELKEEGFRSEAVDHDAFLAAAHIGDWLDGIPKGCALISEQELRRMHKEHLFSWVPKEGGHRADGYWRTIFQGDTGTIALEYERSEKRLDDYSEAAQFYANHTWLFRVIWIVEYEGIARRIHEAVTKIGGMGHGLYNYVRKNDFLKLGWGAPVFLGRDVGKPICHFLPTRRSKADQYISPTLILNGLKSPHMSKPYLNLRKNLKSHRLAFPLVAPSFSNQPLKGDPTNEN